MISAIRHHDFCAGHRVYGHENKCSNFHGHNYRVHFEIEPYPAVKLDKVGRVIDFSVIKEKLCDWLEKHWDHKMLLWEKDPASKLFPFYEREQYGIVEVPFNPTAENMAKYLWEVVGPEVLKGLSVRIHSVVIEETRKCSVKFSG